MATVRKLVVDEATLEELAERVSERIARRFREQLADLVDSPTRGAQNPTQWLTAVEVAEQIGVTRGWVYEHAEELGAVRLGHGRRPRLRFDGAAITAFGEPQTPVLPAADPDLSTPRPERMTTGLIQVDEDW